MNDTILTKSKAYANVETVINSKQKTQSKKYLMPPFITNSFSATLVFATVFGVLAHDTQIDQATIVAIAVPASLTGYALADMASKSNEHVHVEKVSVSSHTNAARVYVPKLQPRDDDRRYIQSKKPSALAGGNTSLWPSV